MNTAIYHDIIRSVHRLNSIQILLAFFEDLIWGARDQYEQFPLMNQVGEWRLVSPILLDRSHRRFHFGLYENSAGVQAIGKQLTLTKSGLDNYWLRNEAIAYATANLAYELSSDAIRAAYPEFRIPRIFAWHADAYRLMMILERVPGESLSSVAMEQRVSILERAIHFIRLLSQKIEQFDTRMLGYRSPAFMVLMTPMICTISLCKYPSQYKNIIRGFWQMMAGAPTLLASRERGFVHRDLGYSNLLIHGDTISVIDFEIATFTHPMIEVIQTVVGTWKRDGFYQEFSQTEMMQDILSNPQAKKLYKHLSVYTGIHALSTTAPQRVEKLITYLDYALRI